MLVSKWRKYRPRTEWLTSGISLHIKDEMSPVVSSSLEPATAASFWCGQPMMDALMDFQATTSSTSWFQIPFHHKAVPLLKAWLRCQDMIIGSFISWWWCGWDDDDDAVHLYLLLHNKTKRNPLRWLWYSDLLMGHPPANNILGRNK